MKYFRLIKEIFSDTESSDFVRLDWKEAGVVAVLMSILFCLPPSIVVGILWWVDPKEGSFWMFAAIPWVMAPVVVVCVYVFNYRRPRRNFRLVERLLSLVRTDEPVRADSGCEYAFVKDGFLFEMCFYTDAVEKPNGNRGRERRFLLLSMGYDCDCGTHLEYLAMLDDMRAYLSEKPLARYLSGWAHLFRADIPVRSATPQWMEQVVGEFLYLAARFRLRPITMECYIERMGRLEKLAEEAEAE